MVVLNKKPKITRIEGIILNVGRTVLSEEDTDTLMNWQSESSKFKGIENKKEQFEDKKKSGKSGMHPTLAILIENDVLKIVGEETSDAYPYAKTSIKDMKKVIEETVDRDALQVIIDNDKREKVQNAALTQIEEITASREAGNGNEGN